MSGWENQREVAPLKNFERPVRNARPMMASRASLLFPGIGSVEIDEGLRECSWEESASLGKLGETFSEIEGENAEWAAV